MRVRVRLFAGTREAVGAPHVEVEVPAGSRVADVVDAVVRLHPRLAAYRPHALLAMDGAFVAPAAAVREGAEVALMPPVSGGAEDRAGKARLQAEPFSLDALLADLDVRGAGGVATFLGVVRATSGERPGAQVERLEFEAHGPLAEAELARLREAAMRKFGLTDCILVHRHGALPVGAPIVAVLAAAPHRASAFEAAAWLMEELKTSVPIWKKEVSSDGEARWVNDPTRPEAA